MRAPVVTEQVRIHATKLDAVSDEIDAVNVLKGTSAWDAASEFDKDKNKEDFRQYDAACDRVKTFYAVSVLYPTASYSGILSFKTEKQQRTGCRLEG